MCNPNVVFGMGAFEEETCFEQISVVSFTYLGKKLYSFVFFFVDFKLI
jgi:hypothetical protein